MWRPLTPAPLPRGPHGGEGESSLHLVDDAPLVGLELRLHALGDRAQPIEERPLVLVDRKPDRRHLPSGALAVVLLWEPCEALQPPTQANSRPPVTRRR